MRNVRLQPEEQAKVLNHALINSGVMAIRHNNRDVLVDRLCKEPQTVGELMDRVDALRDEPGLFDDGKEAPDFARLRHEIAGLANATTWARRKLVEPGRAAAQNDMNPDLSRTVAGNAMETLGIDATSRAGRAIMQQIDASPNGHRAQEIAEIIKTVLAQHTSDIGSRTGRGVALDNYVEMAVMNALQTRPPYVSVMDTNYENKALHVNLGIIHNPITNQLEVWKIRENGMFQLSPAGGKYDGTFLKMDLILDDPSQLRSAPAPQVQQHIGNLNGAADDNLADNNRQDGQGNASGRNRSQTWS
jgi:hypothetical protein